MSMLSAFLGIDARRNAERAANNALAESRRERAKFEKAEREANELKTEEQRKLNKKTTQAARSSMRRQGFLGSDVEGASDVLG